MKRISLSFLISFLAVGLVRAEDSLCINEIMQSNIDGLFVEHDFPDSWVEIYNPTDSCIALKGFSLGPSSDITEAYKFTTADTIRAKSYLVIYCDENKTGLHTHFRLQSVDPGELYLFGTDSDVIASLSYPAMPAPHIAYGRTSDGAEEWGWELSPTPGTANGGGTSDVLLPNPVFSMPGQIMNASGSLTITMPAGSYPDDTKIYVTTDGSEPTMESESGTEFTYDIGQTMVIRAKLMSASALCRRSVTNSYIFHPRTVTMPIVSIVTNKDYMTGEKEGILSSTITDGQANYKYDWRRPMNAEYLDEESSTQWFNQVGEIGVSGNATRTFAQKSMKLFAKKRFGDKRFDGVFWKDKPKVDKVKSFIVRNGGNTSSTSRISDALSQRIFGTQLTNVDYQAFSPAIVYINGEYKGLFGLRERANEDYVEANYDIDQDSIYFATHLSFVNWSGSVAERKQSTFNEIRSLYEKSSTTYAQMAAKIDVDNFMKYMIAEMFSVNLDWPFNNVSVWRTKDYSRKWSWIFRDMDFSFTYAGMYHYDTFKTLLGNESNGTISSTDTEYDYMKKSLMASRIYRKMIGFKKFRSDFIDAYATYLGDFLKPSVTRPILAELSAEIQPEVEPTFAYYQTMQSDYIIDNHYRALAYMDTCLMRRPSVVYEDMAQFFNAYGDSLGTVIPMTVQYHATSVTMNNVALTKGNFDGAFFSKRNLTLNSGAEGVGWQMQTFAFDSTEMAMKALLDSIVDNREIAVLLGDYACDSVSFTTRVFDASEFEKKIEELGIVAEELTDLSGYNAITLAEPRYAYANVTCDSMPQSKTDNVHAYIHLYDNNGNYLKKKVLLNLQGDSKIKNNFSLTFCEDDWIGEETTDVTFGDWVPQDEFHLKGFYSDGFRGTAEIAYQVYSTITERSNCYPKAFPVSLYFNGTFYGTMAWQLKKHRDNMGLEKKVAENVWLDGTLNDKRIFQDTINWTKFEVRNPKGLYNMDGSDYDGDDPQEIIDDTSSAWTGKTKMVRCATAKQYIINLSHYCSELKALEEGGATEEEMRAEFQKRFDVDEIVNYKVFSLVTSNYDGFSKNWQWFTYDGVKWTVAPYDCNLTFGYNEDGTTLWEAEQSSKKYDYQMLNTDTVGPMLYIKKYFWDDVAARYAELRNAGVINTAAIMDRVNDWYERIGEENYAEEWAAWPESPCYANFTDSPARVEKWVKDRIALEDKYLGYVPDTLEYTLTVTDAEWATLCLPFAFEAPADPDFKVYTVSGVDENGVTLVLDEVTTPLANEPYLINAPAGDYHFSGESVTAAADEDFTNGLLTGTLTDTYAPANSYVLQNLSDIIGFYYVSTAETITVGANRAYLTTPTSAKLGHFRISDDVTSINTVRTEDATDETFNIWGQKSEGNQKGLLIKRMPDGSYRKIFIR